MQVVLTWTEFVKSTDDLVMGHVDDHKVSVRKFIPLGQLVSRMAIHLFSLIFLRTVSFLQILSIMGCDQGQNWVFQNRVHTLDLWTHFL